jgi:two-component system cell cycle response regulator DivK
MLSFQAAPRARVAQWIRAFASGAKGRRFDPCRGYQRLALNSPYDRCRSVVKNLSEQDINPDHRPTILVVEDFDDTRLMMKLWLSRSGYHVIEAENGEEAVERAERELPDLIIMDVMMPGLNGLDATRRIRQHQALRNTPIVAVSAYGGNEYRAMALEAGCTEYVSTPFDPIELRALIKKFFVH